MPPSSEAQVWWAEVQHVRESIERRRARAADSVAGVDASMTSRGSRTPFESLSPIDDTEWSSTAPPRSGARADHTGRPQRHDRPRARARRPVDGRAASLRGHDLDGAERERDGSRESRYAHRDDDPGTPAGATAAATTTGPEAAAALAPPPARRTVHVTGRAVAAPPLPRLVEVERRRPPRRTAQRVGPRPDRIALWAVLLGFFLILVAATSSHAATQSAAADTAAVALHAPAR
jgi:hypothetical protein